MCLLIAAFSPGACSSHSMETVPSASPDVNDYTPNLGHLVAGTRDTSQGVGSEILQYGPGTNHGMY